MPAQLRSPEEPAEPAAPENLFRVHGRALHGAGWGAGGLQSAWASPAQGGAGGGRSCWGDPEGGGAGQLPAWLSNVPDRLDLGQGPLPGLLLSWAPGPC